jgi:hypothetical protein
MRDKLIENLKEARALLEKCWIPWSLRDGKGGHCHLGVCQRITDVLSIQGRREYVEMVETIDDASVRLHPELKGQVSPRPYYGNDAFNCTPAVYINNQLGKEAILDVYDDEIARLEVARLCEQEESILESKENNHGKHQHSSVPSKGICQESSIS